jgi:hypothetical protein
MRELFSEETAAAGDAAYQRFALRFTAAKVGVITLASLLIIGMVFLIIRGVKKRERIAA